jgi:chorismate mutase/prephenate dehydratase
MGRKKQDERPAMKPQPRVKPIAYYGEEGSFSHVAARQRFGARATLSCPTMDEAFARLKGGTVSQIVVPIENTSVGIITDTVDQLMALALKPGKKDLAIRECLAMPVAFALLAQSKKTKIAKIYSHFSPLGHCREWLKKTYPHTALVAVSSTSEAARRAREEDDAAALAGLQAAPLYGLKVLRADINKEVANQTKFFVVGQPLVSSQKPTHTSLIFELAHQPGSLMEALNALASNQINLARIESRPIPGRFSEYRFMIEFELAAKTSKTESALRRLKQVTTHLAVVGTYPVLRLK